MAGQIPVAHTVVIMRTHRTKAAADRVITHHITTRDGERLCLLVDPDGSRHLFVYDPTDLDSPAWEIALSRAEAELLAELLHSQPIADQLLSGTPRGRTGRTTSAMTAK